MLPRVTRGSAAKSAASQTPALAPQDPAEPVNPSLQPKAGKNNTVAKGRPNTTRAAGTLGNLPRRKVRTAPPAKDLAKAPKTEQTSPAPKHIPVPSKRAGKRARDINALPHGLGEIPALSDFPVKKARVSRPPGPSLVKVEADPATAPEAPKKKPKTNYGVTLGVTPYPNYARPTPEECQEVVRLLSSIHGDVKQPDKIPEASLSRAGCGEVPTVLDALLRTLVSQNVTMHNAGLALAGLVDKFGIVQEGIGKGSINYNKIRVAPREELVDAIRRLGCQDQKAKQIQEILQMVWEENQGRRAALEATSAVPGSDKEAPESKDAEIAKAEEDVLSLDHLHLLSNQEAFDAFLKYPGIGVKTAACVSLFCLRRPVFAIDTHCYRLAQWLGWVPSAEVLATPTPGMTGKKAKLAALNRDTAFAHLDVRVPDDLKYALHRLFIAHGKDCPRCRAITGEKSEGWENGCVIDHLVKRTGGRKEPGSTAVKKAKKAKTVIKKNKGRAAGNALTKGKETVTDFVKQSKGNKRAKLEESDGDSSELSDALSDSDFE